MLMLSACDHQKRRSVALPQKKSGGLILGTLFAITTVFRRPNRVDGLSYFAVVGKWDIIVLDYRECSERQIAKMWG